MNHDDPRRVLAAITAGLVIGMVEVVLAISLAALMFGGYLAQFMADGIGLYLVAAAMTLALFAWRAAPAGWSADCTRRWSPCWPWSPRAPP